LISVRFKINKYAPYKWGNEAQNLETPEKKLISIPFRRRQTIDPQNEGRKQQRVGDEGRNMPKPEGSPCRKTKSFEDLHLMLMSIFQEYGKTNTVQIYLSSVGGNHAREHRWKHLQKKTPEP
jgi:hypothetical protein